jgi:aromatic-L-amino-acid decarboxylase
VLDTPDELAAEHRRLGATATELVAGYAATLGTARVCSAAGPAELLALFDGPLPEAGGDPDEVLRALARDVVPHAMATSSPRYFGLFNPAPLPVAVWADALCSALNQNGAAWRQSPATTAVEATVLRWLCDLIGYRPGASGTLTSGGSEANLIALKCARDATAPGAAANGLAGTKTGGAAADGPAGARGPLTVYASEQCHYSVVKAADIVGIGRGQVRTIATDGRFRVRVAEVRAAVERDRAAGFRPCCLVGVAGATSTGAVDPLDELAELAEELGLWFHVDAAYGGALALSPRHRGSLRGVERARSVTIDPHKWMFVPFACGALLVRDGGGVLRDAFDSTPAYLDERRSAAGDDGTLDFFRYGQLGTRRANALKLWSALRQLGRRGYAEIIDRQLALTHRLATALAALPDFEPVGTVQTAVCCARYLPPAARALPPALQDALQCELQQRIERGGEAWLATTTLHGRRALRVNVNGYLTRAEHIDALLTLLQREAPTALAQTLRSFEQSRLGG